MIIIFFIIYIYADILVIFTESPDLILVVKDSYLTE